MCRRQVLSFRYFQEDWTGIIKLPILGIKQCNSMATLRDFFWANFCIGVGNIMTTVGVQSTNRRGVGYQLAIAGCHCWVLATNFGGVHVGCHWWVPLLGAKQGCQCWVPLLGCHCWMLATNFGGVHVGCTFLYIDNTQIGLCYLGSMLV